MTRALVVPVLWLVADFLHADLYVLFVNVRSMDGNASNQCQAARWAVKLCRRVAALNDLFAVVGLVLVFRLILPVEVTGDEPAGFTRWTFILPVLGVHIAEEVSSCRRVVGRCEKRLELVTTQLSVL